MNNRLVLDEQLEKHLDYILDYWIQIYFQYEQRATRIATAAGVLATFFGSQLLKSADDIGFEMDPTARITAYIGVVLIVSASLLALSILLPIGSSGASGIRQLRAAEREEKLAYDSILSASATTMSEAINSHFFHYFWCEKDPSDHSDSVRIKSKLAATSHFKRLSSVRGLRNLLAIYLLAAGSGVILLAGLLHLLFTAPLAHPALLVP